MAGFPVAAGPTTAAPTRAEGGALCAACRRRPPAFAYARAALRYEDVAREALHAFKFGGHRALAGPLGDALVEAVEGRLPGGAPDLLVPVPLHPRRERERGFKTVLADVAPGTHDVGNDVDQDPLLHAASIRLRSAGAAFRRPRPHTLEYQARLTRLVKYFSRGRCIVAFDREPCAEK